MIVDTLEFYKPKESYEKACSNGASGPWAHVSSAMDRTGSRRVLALCTLGPGASDGAGTRAPSRTSRSRHNRYRCRLTFGEQPRLCTCTLACSRPEPAPALPRRRWSSVEGRPGITPPDVIAVPNSTRDQCERSSGDSHGGSPGHAEYRLRPTRRQLRNTVSAHHVHGERTFPELVPEGDSARTAVPVVGRCQCPAC